MPKTFSVGKKIYSVDMMISYISIYKPKLHKVNITRDTCRVLNVKSWGDPTIGKYYSAMDVIENPKKKEYANDLRRIFNSDLKYPILVWRGIVVDGMHRFAKACIESKKSIKAFRISDELMNKFIINKKGDWDAIDRLESYDLISLFYGRFCRK